MGRQGNVYKKDNLVMEGELHTSRKEFETKGERSEAVKPKNNLKMEGQLDVSRKELATSGERVEATKPKDNLKLEGKLQEIFKGDQKKSGAKPKGLQLSKD